MPNRAPQDVGVDELFRFVRSRMSVTGAGLADSASALSTRRFGFRSPRCRGFVQAARDSRAAKRSGSRSRTACSTRARDSPRAQAGRPGRARAAATPGSTTFIEPETRNKKRLGWRRCPVRTTSVSPIHRPREFARALGAMVAEQVAPQGGVLRRTTAGDRVFRTAHRSQTVYHGSGRIHRRSVTAAGERVVGPGVRVAAHLHEVWGAGGQRKYRSPVGGRRARARPATWRCRPRRSTPCRGRPSPSVASSCRPPPTSPRPSSK